MKKLHSLIATLLAFCLIFSCFSVVSFVSAEEIEIWDGTAVTTYAGGTGTAGDPYLIENGGQLYNAIKTLGKDSSGKALYYLITKDIYLNANYENYSNWMLDGQAPANNWCSVYSSGAFIGHIDGGYNTVYGLWYSKSDNRVGLIPYMNNGATLSNMYVKNSYVRTGYDANGIICGRLGVATISNVVVYDSIIYNRNGGTPNLGAMAGWADGQGATIINCAAYDMIVTYADVAKTINAGGIVGKATKLINVTNCFSANIDVCKSSTGTDAPVYVREGYIFGNTGYITCTNSHSDVSGSKNGVTHWNATPDSMKGAGAVANMKLSAKVWKDTADSYPAFVAYDNTNEGVKGQVWTGMSATKFAGGDGTEASPFLIETAEQLYKAAMDNGLAGGVAAYYLITADLYINDGYANYATWGENAPANNWLSNTGDFMGHIDGDFHTIYGLYSNRNAWCNGLIATLGNKATISNLIIANAYVYSATNTVGAIAGSMKDNTKIAKCIVRDAVIASPGADLGGIVGAARVNTVTVEDCATYNLTVSGSSACGGILGRSWQNVSGANGVRILRCFSVDNFPVGDTNKLWADSTYTNAEGSKGGVTKIEKEKMQGAGAVANMALSTLVWKDTETYPAFALENGVEGEVWTGAISSRFAGGNGTQANPYLIETAEQLYKAISDLGKKSDGTAAYYLIVADIYLNADYENYTTWGETAPANNWLPTRGDFIGHINGGLHTVYGLYSRIGSWRSGLIPYMNSGATVSDLIVANAYVRNNDSTAGVIAGAMYANTKISKSMVHDAIISTGSTAAGDVGGIVGAVTTNTSTISNCGSYNLTLDVAAAMNAGGIVGRAWQAPVGGNGTRIYNCYSVDNYPIGYQGACWTDYNYTNIDGEKNGITEIDVADMLGTAAINGMKYLDFINTWEAVEDGYPVLRAESSNNLSQEITASYAINDNGNEGVKFVAKVVMPAMNPTYNTNIVITVDGVKKTVSETGIIISRAGIDVTDIATVENTPLTGYKVVGYTNGAAYEAVNFGGYTVVSAIVSGTADYTAKSYITFSDGTTVLGEAYTNAPSTEETTIDGIAVNDIYALGDANFDGTINVVDLVRIKKYAASGDDFAGKTALLDIVDTNADGEFNALDLAGLRQALIAGVEETPAAAMNLVFEENFTQLP